jgi:CRISPR/Cas system CMR-associated protein Cmr3 (group 5 of RAMP superfamily)
MNSCENTNNTQTLICPKCGSDTVKKGNLLYHEYYDYECKKCYTELMEENGLLYTFEKYNAIKLGQRLARVLSKFEEIENMETETIRYKKWLYYSVKNNFWFYVDNNTYPLKISLDTVESLIKDMEEHNGEKKSV